jgi:hypothetical protein
LRCRLRRCCHFGFQQFVCVFEFVFVFVLVSLPLSVSFIVLVVLPVVLFFVLLVVFMFLVAVKIRHIEGIRRKATMMTVEDRRTSARVAVRTTATQERFLLIFLFFLCVFDHWWEFGRHSRCGAHRFGSLTLAQHLGLGQLLLLNPLALELHRHCFCLAQPLLTEQLRSSQTLFGKRLLLLLQ